jgi:hypothetical protein
MKIKKKTKITRRMKEDATLGEVKIVWGENEDQQQNKLELEASFDHDYHDDSAMPVAAT